MPTSISTSALPKPSDRRAAQTGGSTSVAARTAAPETRGDAKVARNAGPAFSVNLSDQARAASRTKAAPDSALPIEADTSLAGLAQRKTDALAERLVTVFKDLGIPLDDATTFKLDSFGKVTTDSPYKKKLEKFFADDPDAAKAFKEVATLNAMRAAQQALEVYAEEKRQARTDDEKARAFDSYTAHRAAIQNLSGEMSFKDGKLTSASMTYIAAVSEAKGVSISDRKPQRAGLLA
ncbi:hypothetical protein [Methylobacterium segetis]|uniref:hypothetical protein n=1 Tax=Methylobacterium segetis TaxID=2488750 RepID=UPI001047BB1D|nr:hypothetical protein [Methylobacterium segetis]